MNIENRAIGLTSLGNPITLISSLENFAKICPNHKIYVCLNVSGAHTTPEIKKKLISNSYKIINYYEKYFKEIVVIENNNTVWSTHGYCIDLIYNIATEEQLAIFEEDAYVFCPSVFKTWFDKLNECDLHCVIAPQNPNNFGQLFGKLNIFKDAINMPGKESVFFINKKIEKQYDWLSFDYVNWESHATFKINSSIRLNFSTQIKFDTFEFFSFNCWLNSNIKKITYHEINYDYWLYESRNNTDEFFTKYDKDHYYMHYFNAGIFNYLGCNNPINKKSYKSNALDSSSSNTYNQHLSTYIIHYLLLRNFKQNFIDILSIDEFNLLKNSIKEQISFLVKYFGYYKSIKNFKLIKFVKFTNKFIKKHHTICK